MLMKKKTNMKTDSNHK